MRFDRLTEGRLLRRYKRFLADVRLADGREITVHCPNTGAMTGCVPPGAPVWLSHSASPRRKYAYTLELVQTGEGLVCIHSNLANRVVQEGFEQGLIDGFGRLDGLRREVRYGGGSRADLCLETAGGPVLVEVKAVTLHLGGGLGAFPDAVSTRAVRHLQELAQRCAAGDRALLVFCVLHNAVRRVVPAAHIHPGFAAALEGLQVQAWRAAVGRDGIDLERRLPFEPGGCADPAPPAGMDTG